MFGITRGGIYWLDRRKLIGAFPWIAPEFTQAAGAVATHQNGKIGGTNFTTSTFQVKSLVDDNFCIGRRMYFSEYNRVSTGFSFLGRINKASFSLSNYQSNTVVVDCGIVDGPDVLLPKDSTGLGGQSLN